MMAYVGRFAPSPTGPLHLGSLIAALGSFLDARQHGGRWLLRIEDLDPPREVAGASAAIQQALQSHGLDWDGTVVFQSQRDAAYAEALRALQGGAFAYACDCSRARLREAQARSTQTPVYPGFCRHRTDVNRPAAWRLPVPASGRIGFEDRIQGAYSQALAVEVGDFVIRRRDGLYAYQLAVVVDDAWQGINQIVRGADLLDNTPRQLWLQRCLDLAPPAYAHLPVATNTAGEKLSKQTHARALDLADPLGNLVRAWHFLGQTATRPEDWSGTAEFIDWAIARWRAERVPRQPAQPAEDAARGTD